MFSPHSIIWAARLYLADKIRKVADVVHEDIRYRVLPYNLVHTKDGPKVIYDSDGRAPGMRLLYASEDYDLSYTPEGDYYEFDK